MGQQYIYVLGPVLGWGLAGFAQRRNTPMAMLSGRFSWKWNTFLLPKPVYDSIDFKMYVYHNDKL